MSTCPTCHQPVYAGTGGIAQQHGYRALVHAGDCADQWRTTVMRHDAHARAARHGATTDE